MLDENWTKSEKAVAHRAYNQAYERETKALADEVRRLANGITEATEIWRLHDFLTRRRKDIDLKYDYRYSVLLLVFTRLIREGWIKETELAGLSEDKLSRIRSLLEIRF